ncbi:MAG: membrane protein insertase YidC [Vicinamibacterales bacterium]|jgi:YidC/Oxa1 family membrane protein insertase|nr:membrane protein insertase YidC [Vicinamibacterales bacterium]
MAIWEQVVEILRGSIFVYAQACGGNLGGGILAVTLLARLALFPLTLRVARLSAAHQERMRQLKPELDALRRRFKDDPRRQAEETRRAYARAGVSLVPRAGCLGMLVQTPVLLALFSAVRSVSALGGRFLWLGSIARPDLILAVVVAALTGAAVALGPQSVPQGRTLLIILPTVVTLVALSQMASGIGLYWGVSSAGSLVQAVVLRRERRLLESAG